MDSCHTVLLRKTMTRNTSVYKPSIATVSGMSVFYLWLVESKDTVLADT